MCASPRQSAPLSCQCAVRKKERKQTPQGRDGKERKKENRQPKGGMGKKERKKTDNPMEGWENGTPPPHRDFKERSVTHLCAVRESSAR